MSEEQMTHNQHVVPQVYLKHFAIEKMCYVIDGYGKIQKKSIEGICYEDDYYEFRSAEGNIVRPNWVENDLLGKVETMYSDFLDDLRDALESNDVKRFMRFEDNGLCLITWMVIMLLRSPVVFKLTPEVAAELGIEWDAIQSRNNAILNISALTEHFSRKLYDTHKIVFIKNKTDISFLTGNYPSLILKDSHGELKGYMPLSPQYYVFLVDRDNDIEEYSIYRANESEVELYNRNMIRNVLHVETDVKYKYIISGNKESLEHYMDFVKKELSK